MDLKVFNNTENEIKKKSFTLNQKPNSRNGLVLRVHYTDSRSVKLRFLYTCFNISGNLLAASDTSGNLFFINLVSCKFWSLPTLNSCTFLRFSPVKSCEILIGLKSNEIVIVNFERGSIVGKLTGHKSIPLGISFNGDFSLSFSKTEAILWSSGSNSCLKVLEIEKKTLLKYVVFLPESHRILGCYVDDSINVWDFGTFNISRAIDPSVWNMEIKNYAISEDGSVMVVSGTNPVLAIYSLRAWKIVKFVDLPEHIKSIRLIKFIERKNDQAILAILSRDGVISFFDILENFLVSELKTENEIIKFDHSNNNDEINYLSCVLCTGNIEIFDLAMYIEKPETVKALTKKNLKVKLLQKASQKKIEEIKNDLDDVLNIDKLRLILKEHGEYPETYRMLIWEQLLQLPNNDSIYEGIIKYQVHNAFPNLDKEYPDKNRSLKCLKLLLDNLVTWCGFFAHVYYLPVFVYPFVKVFQNRPIVCFEAVVTIIVNWCQYWFEYFPLPPINILSIIENMLLEFDPIVLLHIHKHGITSKQYAWPLLESAFSEVLTSRSWFVFWDHVLTNEPSFLICSVVAYNVMQRTAILNIKNGQQLEAFYHKQNVLDMKRFIAKCYVILEKTNDEIHPRRYLNMFSKLPKGIYPVFQEYPKVIIENEVQKISNLKKELQNIEEEEARLLIKEKKQIDKMLDSDLESIEKKRLFEMKKACNVNLQHQQELAKQHLQRLSKLRRKFDEHQAKVLRYSKSDQLRKRLMATDMLFSEIETNKKTDEYQAEKAETLLLRHYSELIKHKMNIEALLQDESSPIDEPKLHNTINREHRKFLKDMQKISQSPGSEKRIRQYNIFSSVVAMDDLIKKVERALAKELSNEYVKISRSEGGLRIYKLKTEIGELEAQVNNLLSAISRSKIEESKSKFLDDVDDQKRLDRKSHSYPVMKKISELSIQTDLNEFTSEPVRRVKRFTKKLPSKNVTFNNVR